MVFGPLLFFFVYSCCGISIPLPFNQLKCVTEDLSIGSKASGKYYVYNIENNPETRISFEIKDPKGTSIISSKKNDEEFNFDIKEDGLHSFCFKLC